MPMKQRLSQPPTTQCNPAAQGARRNPLRVTLGLVVSLCGLLFLGGVSAEQSPPDAGANLNSSLEETRITMVMTGNRQFRH